MITFETCKILMSKWCNGESLTIEEINDMKHYVELKRGGKNATQVEIIEKFLLSL